MTGYDLNQNRPGTTLERAEVTSIDPFLIRPAGATNSVPARHLDGYDPTIGDLVEVAQLGASLVVLGHTTTNPTPPHARIATHRASVELPAEPQRDLPDGWGPNSFLYRFDSGALPEADALDNLDPTQTNASTPNQPGPFDGWASVLFGNDDGTPRYLTVPCDGFDWAGPWSAGGWVQSTVANGDSAGGHTDVYLISHRKPNNPWDRLQTLTPAGNSFYYPLDGAGLPESDHFGLASQTTSLNNPASGQPGPIPTRTSTRVDGPPYYNAVKCPVDHFPDLTGEWTFAGAAVLDEITGDTTSGHADVYPFYMHGWATSGIRLSFMTRNNLPPYIEMWDTGNTRKLSGGSLTIGQWIHWAITKDASGTVRLYINGSLADSADWSSQPWVNPTINRFLQSGSGWAGTAGNGIARARVTDILALEDQVLTPTEIAKLSEVTLTPASGVYIAAGVRAGIGPQFIFGNRSIQAGYRAGQPLTLNEWTHWALTHDGSGRMRLYLHGEQVDTWSGAKLVAVPPGTPVIVGSAWTGIAGDGQSLARVADHFLLEDYLLDANTIRALANPYTLGEQIELPISRHGNPAGPATATVQIVGGNGQAGTDYLDTAPVVTWADGDNTTKTARIPLGDRPTPGRTLLAGIVDTANIAEPAQIVEINLTT